MLLSQDRIHAQKCFPAKSSYASIPVACTRFPTVKLQFEFLNISAFFSLMGSAAQQFKQVQSKRGNSCHYCSVLKREGRSEQPSRIPIREPRAELEEAGSGRGGLLVWAVVS